MKDIVEEDFIGHEKFKDEAEMYATYKSYYGEEKVTPDSLVKMVDFVLEKTSLSEID